MAKPLIPFIKSGFFGTSKITPLVHGNGLGTPSGDDDDSDNNKVGTAKIGTAKAG